MTKRRPGTLGLLALGAVLLLCSCGGGSSSKRLTKEQYAAKANALCADYLLKVAAIPNSKTEAEGVKVIANTGDLLAQAIAGLKKLQPPANEQAVVDRALKLADEHRAAISQSVLALQKRDLKKNTALTTRILALKKESEPLFSQLGATSCVM